MVTKIVLPVATVTPVWARLLAVELPVACAPINVGLMVLRMVTLNAPEDSETLPAASVAVEVMLCAPAVRMLVVRPGLAYAAAVPLATCVTPSSPTHAESPLIVCAPLLSRVIASASAWPDSSASRS